MLRVGRRVRAGGAGGCKRVGIARLYLPAAASRICAGCVNGACQRLLPVDLSQFWFSCRRHDRL